MHEIAIEALVMVSGVAGASSDKGASTFSGTYSMFAVEICPVGDNTSLTTGPISFAGDSFTKPGTTAVNNLGSAPFQESSHLTGTFKDRSQDKIIWDGINGVVSFGKVERGVVRSAVVQFLDPEAKCDWQITFERQS